VKEAEFEAERQRLKDQQARTLDEVVPEMQAERDHNYKGKESETGIAYGRHLRHAKQHGWFSYDMKVAGDKPLDLIITYCGGFGANEPFDILIDGQKIATTKRNKNKAGEFFDVVYPISKELTKGKVKVTVRFQSHPGVMTNDVYGCRIVKQ
jgi:hypothetical protein